MIIRSPRTHWPRPLALLFFIAPIVWADTYVVTTAGDDGPGSLRQAINDANAHPNSSATDPDRIVFAIPNVGVQTIYPLRVFPDITDAVVIDGYSQRGTMPNSNSVRQGLNGTLNVQLDGIKIPLAPSSIAFTISSGPTIIRGLVINRFSTGILVKGGNGNIIEGNYIGTDPTGTFAPKVDYPEDQQAFGVALRDSAGTRIGGQDPKSRNLIAGNWLADVLITGFFARSNVVEGNIMGLNASGTMFVRAFNFHGSTANVRLENNAADNLIGGTKIEARNVMGGYDFRGTHVGVQCSPGYGGPVWRNLVKGNLIGLDVTGTVPTDPDSSPGGIGIILRGDHNVVGGTEPEARNVISGNRSGGVIIAYNPYSRDDITADNVIQGNFIGTDESGLRPVPNGRFGVEITGSSANNVIGGSEPGAGNLIAYHALHGVELHLGFPTSGTGNAILGNSIYANGGLGIELGDDNVSANDAGDTDSGPNNLQNYPVLDAADFVAGLVKVRGTLKGVENTNYRIEFFGDTAADGSGFGEGRVFLGAASFVAGADGTAAFDVRWSYPAGTRIVSATATDPDGNTSEFSKAVTIAGVPASQVLNISSRGRVLLDDNVIIGGVIVGGPEAKKVVFRAIGPSLDSLGIKGTLTDPTLTLYDNVGAVVAWNDNWADQQYDEIRATGFSPRNTLESAIVATLKPNQAYSVVVRGKDNATGIALVEAYDVGQGSYAQVLNISTRAFVATGENVLIGGLIVGGSSASTRVVIRALGPSLRTHGINNALINPTLELRNQNGDLLQFNDDWKETQVSEISGTGLAPENDAESAIVATLPPGNATAIVRGKNDTTGIGLVEIYNVP